MKKFCWSNNKQVPKFAVFFTLHKNLNLNFWFRGGLQPLFAPLGAITAASASRLAAENVECFLSLKSKFCCSNYSRIAYQLAVLRLSSRMCTKNWLCSSALTSISLLSHGYHRQVILVWPAAGCCRSYTFEYWIYNVGLVVIS